MIDQPEPLKGKRKHEGQALDVIFAEDVVRAVQWLKGELKKGIAPTKQMRKEIEETNEFDWIFKTIDLAFVDCVKK